MPKFSRGVIRFLAILAAVALSLPVGTSLLGAVAGRDYSRCVQACNDARLACDARCTTDCRALYPSNKTLRDACISACKTICNTQSDDCKLVCKTGPPPPTWQEP